MSLKCDFKKSYHMVVKTFTYNLKFSKQLLSETEKKKKPQEKKLTVIRIVSKLKGYFFGSCAY